MVEVFNWHNFIYKEKKPKKKVSSRIANQRNPLSLVSRARLLCFYFSIIVVGVKVELFYGDG